MTNAHPPEEILFNHIFCRLPVKSILRFRSVCKAWNCMLREPQLVKHHLKIHQQQACNDKKKKLLVRTNLTNFSNYFSSGTKVNSYYSIDCESIVAASPPEIPGIVVSKVTHFLGSCNGLVAMIIAGNLTDILLWNPSTGESKHLIHTHPTLSICDLFGFVYDSITDNYKIICMGVIMFRESHVDIYSLRNNSWKRVKGPPRNWDLAPAYCTQLAGVEVNGYFYWMVTYYRRDRCYPHFGLWFKR
ncbi:hypothetical protein OROGR_033214 [Orobanche gracilis]